MSGYGIFARYYDSLTANIDYQARAAYFKSLLDRHGDKTGGKLLLDLGCGTGSLTLELARLGFEMIGADASPEMLSIASAKEHSGNILWICQPMWALRLHAPVDGIVCALDSINHVTELAKLQKTFALAAKYLHPGGLFVFDANSLYKHEQVLADNTFLYETEQVYCVWQNAYDAPKKQTAITLDFFEEQEDGAYLRYTEQFSERAYTPAELDDALGGAGLTTLAVYEGDTTGPVGETTQRLVYVTQKPPY